MDEKQGTAILICYAFPPNGAVGSMRPLRWCRYVPRVSDWNCAVITVDKQPVRVDHSLLGAVPADTRVVRTPISEPWYLLNPPSPSRNLVRRLLSRLVSPFAEPLKTPDPQVYWRRHLVPAGLKLVRETGARVIVATAPPWSALLGAAELARRAELPLVVDFRDPWVEIERDRMSPWRRSWERRAEARVCTQARAAISTSDTYSQNLAARHPHLPAERFVTLHNGFDEEAFDAAGDPGVAPAGLRIVHLGSLYARFQSNCSPLVGLRRWLDAHPDREDQIRLVFIGSPDSPTKSVIAANGLEHLVEITGHLPHAEAIAEARRADLLLLNMGGGDRTPAGWLPSKLFEYIAIGRPVLAHTVPGEAACLLERAGAARVIAGDDPDDFATALEDYWQAKADLGHAPDHANRPEVVEELRQRSLACRFAGILDRAVGACP